jgi:hypothetical protein
MSAPLQVQYRCFYTPFWQSFLPLSSGMWTAQEMAILLDSGIVRREKRGAATEFRVDPASVPGRGGQKDETEKEETAKSLDCSPRNESSLVAQGRRGNTPNTLPRGLQSNDLKDRRNHVK